MAAVVIHGMGKRKKEQEATGDDNDSLSCNKKARLVWSNDLHAKFVAAVNELGLHEMGKRKNDDDNDSLSCNKKARLAWSKDLHAKFVAAVNELGLHKAVPKKIVTLMNVEGITTAHVASHLQKYRLRLKKAADRIPSTTQSQYIINTSVNIHQSDTVPAQVYSPSGLNITEVQSQSFNNNSLNIHPPPSTFPTHSQNIINNSFNIHPSYNFPLSQTSTLLLPNNMPLHHSHTVPNTEIYSPTAFNISRVTASTLLRSPTQSQNINDTSSIIHSPPSTFPTSKSTSIWDDDWYTKYLKRKPQSLQFSHNSLPVLESDINNSHNVEPFTVGSATSLEDKNIDISDYTVGSATSLEDKNIDISDYTVGSATSLEDKNIDISDYNLCSENSPIDFSVEETNCNTLEWGCLEEDLIDVWRFLEEENVLNVKL